MNIMNDFMLAADGQAPLMDFLTDNLRLLLIIGACLLAFCAIIYVIFRKKLNALIIKYKEAIMYLVFGVLTTAVNFAVYIPLTMISDNSVFVLAANVAAWVCAVAFAFITNKLFVFGSKTTEKKALLKELGAFVGARLLSLGAEEVILLIFVVLLHLNEIAFKLVTQVIVLVMNYVFSKLFIFKKKD